VIIQRVNRTNPEKVFIIVRNDDSVFTKGQPICFKFDGTNDGLDVEDATSSAAAKSTLLAGLADSAIPAGAYGLCQVYGVRTDAVVMAGGSVSNSTGSIGDQMVLHHASDCLSVVSTGLISQYMVGCVLGETVDSSGSKGTTTATVFLRLM